MTQKKLKCRQEDYEFLKEVRWEYNKTRQKIDQLEREITEMMEKAPIEDYEFGIRGRNIELQNLQRRKQELNDLVQEFETNCFGSEE